ncbi:hypothetical protein SEA_OBLADI_80 [Gordonia phage ObLaDi]|uniref:Uncharacterized protein n=3 Tax=Cafassovirus TaxID=3425056 RepID=A0A9E7QBZ7_9CAUD|nr:hypothetical protein SEA_ALEEMILY_79 [Gordonia phage Aleemily]UXE03803.1 hypothetical protein SEA_OBLADI_80 [Gordonia phage ObLaDi]
MSEPGMDNDPTAILRTFAEAYCDIAESALDPHPKRQHLEQLIAEFSSQVVVMPAATYRTEVERTGEWQNRARRIINAVNRMLDQPYCDDANVQAYIELREAMVANDFRIED